MHRASCAHGVFVSITLRGTATPAKHFRARRPAARTGRQHSHARHALQHRRGVSQPPDASNRTGRARATVAARDCTAWHGTSAGACSGQDRSNSLDDRHVLNGRFRARGSAAAAKYRLRTLAYSILATAAHRTALPRLVRSQVQRRRKGRQNPAALSARTRLSRRDEAERWKLIVPLLVAPSSRMRRRVAFTVAPSSSKSP